MISVTSLVAGDEVVGWMKSGLALTKIVPKESVSYYRVPERPQKFRGDDITTWTGIVTGNALGTLSVAFHKRDHLYQPTGPSSTADIPYWALWKLAKYSETHQAPRDDVDPERPTYGQQKFAGSPKPFRTLTTILL